jgi:hypothetical protein
MARKSDGSHPRCLLKSVFFMNYHFKRLRKVAENDYQLRHVCLSLCPSVCRPVRMEYLSSHWTNFHEIWNLRIFRQFVTKTQVLLNLTKITCTLHGQQFSFLITPRSYILRIKNVLDKFVDKIKTYFYAQFFFPENHAIYEIMWKNILVPVRPQVKIWHMRITCWITRAKDSHSEYKIFTVFPPISVCTNGPQYYVIHTLTDLLLR